VAIWFSTLTQDDRAGRFYLFKVVNIFKILKIKCWAVSHLRAASLGGRDVPYRVATALADGLEHVRETFLH
jgi:hypothetical protein